MYAAIKKFMTEPEYIAKTRANLKKKEKLFDNQQIFDAVENIIINLTKN